MTIHENTAQEYDQLSIVAREGFQILYETIESLSKQLQVLEGVTTKKIVELEAKLLTTQAALESLKAQITHSSD